MPEERTVMELDAIVRAWRRVAHEIAEAHPEGGAVILVGIQRGGVPLAQLLGETLGDTDGEVEGHAVGDVDGDALGNVVGSGVASDGGSVWPGSKHPVAPELAVQSPGHVLHAVFTPSTE